MAATVVRASEDRCSEVYLVVKLILARVTAAVDAHDQCRRLAIGENNCGQRLNCRELVAGEQSVATSAVNRHQYAVLASVGSAAGQHSVTVAGTGPSEAHVVPTPRPAPGPRRATA